MKKSKKKNKFIPMIVLLVFLGVMLLAYSALSKSNAAKEALEAEQQAAESEVTMIAENDYTTMTALSYQISGYDEYSFAVSGSSWIYTSDENFPLDQTPIIQMAAAIAQIGVAATVEEGEEADYGLDDPSLTVKVEYADGSRHTYSVGDYNSFNSSYYFSADGEFYMVASALLDYFSYTLDDLILRDTIPSSDWSDVNYVNYVELTRDGAVVKIEDSEVLSELLSTISEITTDDYADYFADDEEKSAYGLDGSSKLVVNYRKAKTVTDDSGNESTSYLETNYDIIFGNEEDGMVYFSLKDSDIVYRMSAEVLSTVMAYIN